GLRDLERELERQGYLQRGPEGLELTPKALRRLRHDAARALFAPLQAPPGAPPPPRLCDQLEPPARGDHDDRRSGAADERTGAVLPWEFGDERPIDAVRTVHNAVLRKASEPAVSTDRVVRLAVEDFAVAE